MNKTKSLNEELLREEQEVDLKKQCFLILNELE